ncbi:MAG TPA: hypothetical protein VJV23_03125 [Candidatus Polarisedimenticolia bacterium]|nr:hypothetical protein [Candidatus Polarisedimenticolia bacterium]
MTIASRWIIGLRGPGLALALLALAVPAHATTLKRMDLSELVRGADRVVHARAAGTRVYWDPSGTQIYTDTRFEVVEEAKGRGPRTLTLTTLGGRMGEVVMSVEGTPAFEQGSEAVLFTAAAPDGRRHLVGFSQGVMRVIEDSRTGDRFAVSETPAGVTVMERTGTGLAPVRPRRQRASLPQLLDEIRRIAQGEPAGPRLLSRPQKAAGAAPAPQEGRP